MGSEYGGWCRGTGRNLDGDRLNRGDDHIERSFDATRLSA